MDKIYWTNFTIWHCALYFETAQEVIECRMKCVANISIVYHLNKIVHVQHKCFITLFHFIKKHSDQTTQLISDCNIDQNYDQSCKHYSFIQFDL